MSKSTSPLIVLTVGLVIGTGGLWLALQGRLDALDERVRDAEAAAGRAERDAADWKASAAMEVQRNSTLQERVDELEKLIRTSPAGPPQTADTGHGGGHGGETGGDDPAPPKPPADPGTWDEPTYRRNISFLTSNPAAARQSKLYAAVLEAARVRGEKGRQFLASLVAPELGMDAPTRTVAVMLLEDLGEPDVMPQLLAAYDRITPEDGELLHNTLLNALAVLPGDEPTSRFLAVLEEEGVDRLRQRAALRGIARRRHPRALEIARGETKGIGKALRYVVIGNLNVAEREAGYKSVEVRTAFEQALPKVDGDNQARVILEALKRYWSETSVEALQTFGDGVIGTPRTRSQARQMADAIASGAPRPELDDPDGVVGQPLDGGK